jgi:hypothetical protein
VMVDDWADCTRDDDAKVGDVELRGALRRVRTGPESSMNDEILGSSSFV